MSASRDYCGDSDSPFYMTPEDRAEALCDELRSGTRDGPSPGCVCVKARKMIEAAVAHRKPPPRLARLIVTFLVSLISCATARPTAEQWAATCSRTCAVYGGMRAAMWRASGPNECVCWPAFKEQAMTPPAASSAPGRR